MNALRQAYRRLRQTIRCALGRDVRFPIQTRVPAQRHGSEYGGWWVCPTGLTADSVVYSLGIGTDISFDLSMIETFGVAIHAFDPTPGSIHYLQGRQLPDVFRFHAFGVGAYDGPARFFLPENPAHISHTLVAPADDRGEAIDVEVRRLSSIMHDLDHSTIDVLKMDIEGAEYDVLDEILDGHLPVRQILVEFHHRFRGIDVDRTRRTVQRLNAAGYRIFAASISGEEYSFILASETRVKAHGNTADG
jgi:FkbM family methyltransferase